MINDNDNEISHLYQDNIHKICKYKYFSFSQYLQRVKKKLFYKQTGMDTYYHKIHRKHDKLQLDSKYNI